MIGEVFKTYTNFINQGGPVVLILFFISIYLFILISAKFKFLFSDIEILKAEYKQNLLSLKKDQLYSLNLSALKCDFKNLITKDFYIIQTLIALCPVLGLLGTVTGMIEVFDVMAYTGTGNPRAMASGVSKATLPTMTGLVISISGLFAITVVERFIQDKTNKKIAVFDND